MEKYIQDGIIKNTKDELIISDDTICYITHNCNGDEIVYNNCEKYAVGDKGGIRIKYGKGSSFSFRKYNNGEIDERWELID